MSIKTIAAPTKFEFDESFGEAPVETDADRLRAEVSGLQSQVEQARQEAYAAGLDQGREEGRQAAVEAIEAQIAQTLQGVAGAVQDLTGQHERIVDRLEMAAVQISHQMATAMAPAAMARFAEDSVIDALGEALSSCRQEPDLVLHLPSSLSEAITARVDAIKEQFGFKGTLTVAADPALTVGQARLEWRNGGAEFNTERLHEAVDAAVQSLVDAVDAPADADPVTGEAAAPADPVI